MLAHISRIGVQSQADTTNVVTLVNVMEGVAGSSTFGYSVIPGALLVDDGQTQQYAHGHELDIRILEADGTDLIKLQVMDANQDRVKATAFGPDGAVVFYDEAQMVRSTQFDDVVAARFLVTRLTAVGYQGGIDQVLQDFQDRVTADGGTQVSTSHTEEVISGISAAGLLTDEASLLNTCCAGKEGVLYSFLGRAEEKRQSVIGSRDLLEIFDTSSGNAYLLNGFVSEGNLTLSVSGSSQSLTRSLSGSSTSIVSRRMLFPFPDVRVQATAGVTSVTGTGLVGITAYDAAGAELTTASAAISGTGTATATITLPTGTVEIAYIIRPGTVLNDAVSFTDPKLLVTQ